MPFNFDRPAPSFMGLPAGSDAARRFAAGVTAAGHSATVAPGGFFATLRKIFTAEEIDQHAAAVKRLADLCREGNE